LQKLAAEHPFKPTLIPAPKHVHPHYYGMRDGMKDEGLKENFNNEMDVKVISNKSASNNDMHVDVKVTVASNYMNDATTEKLVHNDKAKSSDIEAVNAPRNPEFVDDVSQLNTAYTIDGEEDEITFVSHDKTVSSHSSNIFSRTGQVTDIIVNSNASNNNRAVRSHSTGKISNISLIGSNRDCSTSPTTAPCTWSTKNRWPKAITAPVSTLIPPISIWRTSIVSSYCTPTPPTSSSSR